MICSCGDSCGFGLETQKANDNATDDEAGSEEMEALRLAEAVRAQPTGDVVSEIACEVGSHVDQTRSHCGGGGGERERWQCPKRRDPEKRSECSEAEPCHLSAEATMSSINLCS